MKQLLLCISIVAAATSQASAYGRSCTTEQIQKGCHTEDYDCDRPTHYTCQACICSDLGEGKLHVKDESFESKFIGKLVMEPGHTHYGKCGEDEISMGCLNELKLVGNPNADHWAQFCVCH